MTKVHANNLQGGELLISQTAGVREGHWKCGRGRVEGRTYSTQIQQRRTLNTEATRSLSLSSHYSALTLVRMHL